MDHAKQETRLGRMPIGSSAKEKTDRAIDEAALTISDLITQFNDPEKHHILKDYFKSNYDLRRLEANLCKAEAQFDKAMQILLREERQQLKMLRKAVDYLLSQSHT
ncbi:MAG: hypothetical protein MN733_34695 [Nitrososphaera sp.]|nr:hypothetical protein [Nitrososphaera sp.]